MVITELPWYPTTATVNNMIAQKLTGLEVALRKKIDTNLQY